MALLSGSFLIDFFLGLVLLVCLLYWYFTKNNDYWDNRGVKNMKKGFLMGSLMGKQSISETILEFYQTFSGERFGGFFQFDKPVLLIRDLELIQKVMVKDFANFQDRGQPQFKHDPLSGNLFNLNGQVWRALRYKLTPTFTTGKLRGMFDQVIKCGDNMIAKIEEPSKKKDSVESKSFLFEFTVEVISSCAFGLQFKPNSPEFDLFKTTVTRVFTASPMSFFRFAMSLSSPKLANFIKLRQFPKESADYFVDLTKATSKYRKDNNIKRNDYFQLMLTLKEEEESGKDMGLTASADANEEDAVVNQMQYAEQMNQFSTSTNIKLFTDESICANTFIFLVAGSESVASTISFILFELSQHPDIQEKLQQELDVVLGKHGAWTYDAVKELTYLDQVIQEAQRLYPVVSMLFRECIQPYKVPDSDLVIEKGVLICIPVVGLHKDPQHYPDPDQFKPERFEGNNFKPNPTYLPFGDGPRICIAMRFAVLEVKICVARIMSQYSIKLNSKTRVPLKFNVRSFTLSVEDGIWLEFEKRKTSSL